MKKNLFILIAILFSITLHAQEFLVNQRIEPVEGTSYFQTVSDTIYFTDLHKFGVKLDTVKIVYHKIINQSGAIGYDRGYLLTGTKGDNKILERVYNEFFKQEPAVYSIRKFDWK